MLFFVPVMLLIGLFSEPIVQLIFERGEFSARSTELTASALSVYNWGIVAFALETILVVFMYGKGQIKLPVVIGMVCVTLNILITWGLIGKFSYLAIAWGLVLSKWLKIGLLIYFVRQNLEVSQIFRKSLKFMVALCVFAAPVLVYRFWGLSLIHSKTGLVGSLGLLVGIAFAAYIWVLIKIKLVDTKNGLS